MQKVKTTEGWLAGKNVGPSTVDISSSFLGDGAILLHFAGAPALAHHLTRKQAKRLLKNLKEALT